MNNKVWTFFVGGLFSVALVSILMQNTRAESDDPRVVKVDDPSISALKTDVPGVAEIESALVKRDRELALREEQLKTQEERLKSEEERLRYRIEELEKLQEEITAFETKEKAYDEAVFKKLVKTFESMQPKKAAAVISAAEDPFAIELLTAMKDKKVAAVLELMEPARATALSSLIAKRKPAGSRAGGGDGAKARP